MARAASSQNTSAAIDIGTKFDFIIAVLANPEWRNRRKAPPLTPVALAVMVKLVQRYNIAWGYSATSCRTIADELSTSPATVHNAIAKLCSMELLLPVANDKTKRSNRYAPNFNAFSAIGLNSAVQGHSTEHLVQGHRAERSVQGHGAERNVMKRTIKEVEWNEPRSTSPPRPEGGGSLSRGPSATAADNQTVSSLQVDGRAKSKQQKTVASLDGVSVYFNK